MVSLTVTEARNSLSDVVNKVAFKGERFMLVRNGKNVVAVISAEDAEFLELMEDKIDIEEARKRMADGKPYVDLDEVERRLGLK